MKRDPRAERKLADLNAGPAEMTIFHCFLQRFLFVNYNHQMRNLLLTCAFIMTACAPNSVPNTTNNSLAPYLTATPSLTPAPNVLVIVETPIPTSTPLAYTIKSGDTFSELAEQFKISQDDLRAANPDVSPNSMSVGTILLIPEKSDAFAAASSPTPVPAPVTQAVCHPTADGGLWCFALIQNTTPDILENVSAQITLLDESDNALASQTAFMPLDIIPPNTSLPVYVFFPNMPASANIQVQVLSAIQSNSFALSSRGLKQRHHPN